MVCPVRRHDENPVKSQFPNRLGEIGVSRWHQSLSTICDVRTGRIETQRDWLTVYAELAGIWMCSAGFRAGRGPGLALESEAGGVKDGQRGFGIVELARSNQIEGLRQRHRRDRHELVFLMRRFSASQS